MKFKSLNKRFKFWLTISLLSYCWILRSESSDTHWSYIPPKRSKISALNSGNPIDYFKAAPLETWMIAIYLGFIMQPITYGCFYYVLKNNPLYKVLPIVTMGIPPTGLLAAIFLLGEEPTKELFIGGAIIIIGVILIIFNKPQKK